MATAIKLPKGVDRVTRQWVRTENDRRAVLAGCRFDLAAAEHVRTFFSTFLRHSKGAFGGKPFDLLEWQWQNVVGPIFGWKRPDGSRRIRKTIIFIPKKNGKSTLGAGVGNYMFLADGEAGAEVYSTATKQEQARLVHEEAERMIKASPQLAQRVRINRTTKVISNEATFSKYAALASDGAGSEGINAHCLIIDEIHAWKDIEFWDSLRYASAARTQPLTFIISTAGEYDTEGIGHREYAYAKQVISGEVEDDSVLAFVAEAAEGDDIGDPKVHEHANPSFRVTIDPDEMAREAQSAIDKPHERLAFQRYRLNIWTQALTSFFDTLVWDETEEPIDDEQLVGRRCFGGLDLASKTDVAAWVLLFPPNDDDPYWRMLERYFVPADNALYRERRDRVGYHAWGNQGYLTLTDGNVIDYGVVRQQIIDDGQRYGVVEIAADRWNLEYLRQTLGDLGVDIYEFGQGFASMSEPTKELHKIVTSKAMRHNGNPVTRWMLGNTIVRMDPAGNIKPDKQRSKEKIDGVVAMVMALGRHMVAESDIIFDRADAKEWMAW